MTNDESGKSALLQSECRSRLIETSSALDRELWVRRHDRRELELIEGLAEDIRPLAPLVLALTRLAAQRDAAVIAAHRSGVQP